MRMPKWMMAAALGLAFSGKASLSGQEKLPGPLAAKAEPAVLRLTLDDVKARALANNKLLSLASLNVQHKEQATRIMQSNYFPQVIGSAVYLHFDESLGNVLTTRGRPLLGVPPMSFSVAVVNQDAAFGSIVVAQPLTALLKVRQGVNAARADEQIAQAQLDRGTRALVSGAEQLFWGLRAARRISAGAAAGAQGLEMLAKTKTLEARTALLEAKQALRAAESQVADLQDQLRFLLDLPDCTQLDLEEPPLPVSDITCVDEAVAAALQTSPDIREVEQDVLKAQAGRAAAKVDYLPSVNLIGGVASQSAANYIQREFGFVGVQASYTFIDWGKRRHTLRQFDTLEAMANLKVQQTIDDVRQKAAKAFREVALQRESLETSKEMAQLRAEALKAAKTPSAMIAAGKDQLLAEVELVKTEMNYRVAHANLLSLAGR
jgi:outer membrane protein TolC